jgi:hypothetical protein
MIMLFNQLLDMPHLSSGWFILANEKCSLTGMQTHFCTKFEGKKLFLNFENFTPFFLPNFVVSNL